MLHYWSLEDVNLKGVWLTVGSYDGVHLGHQAIIHALTAGARTAGELSVVITFHPHPATVLRDRKGAFYLTTPEEQAAILGALGADVVITHPFTREVANTPAKEFILKLKQHLGMRHFCIGHDFALGRNREGDAQTLSRFGEEMGFSVSVVQPVEMDGGVVSSSRTRQSLADGDISDVNRLLGRPYLVNGTVIPGDGRGRTLGIPTANLDVWQEKALPKAGVYACTADVGGRTFPAVTNIGVRPTFEDQPVKPRLETHILDLDADLYGREISLAFIARLRDEMRFSNIDMLVKQIKKDIRRTREILEMERG